MKPIPRIYSGVSQIMVSTAGDPATSAGNSSPFLVEVRFSRMSITRLISWIIIAIVASIALYVGVFFAKKHFSAEEMPTEAVQFALKDYLGVEQPQSQWQDKVLLINFWATWCAPCREEMPLLADFQDRYQEQGLQVIGITLDDPEPVQRFADTMDINYPLLISDDTTPDLMYKYNEVGAIPFSLITNRQGIVVDKKLGVFTADELKSIIKPLLN